jgi:hypothetical protein
VSASPSWAAIAAGAIGLAVLDGVVSRAGAADNLGGWIGGAGKAVQWFLSPAVPAFNVTSAPAATGTGAAPLSFAPAAGATVTPPSSSASSQPSGPRVGGPPVTISSPVGPIQEVAA